MSSHSRQSNMGNNSEVQNTSRPPFLSSSDVDDNIDSSYGVAIAQHNQQPRSTDLTNEHPCNNMEADNIPDNAIAISASQQDSLSATISTDNTEEDNNQSLDFDTQIDRSDRNSLRYVLKWERMIGLTSLIGSNRFSRNYLKFLEKCIKTATKGSVTIPTYKTVKGSQWKFMIDSLFVRSSIVYVGLGYTANNRTPPPTSKTI